MELRRLRVFAVVADTGYVTHAADRLHMSQSAVSQQVSALEREIGASLFARTRHGVQLTPAGRALRSRVDDVFSALDTAVADTRRAAVPVTGRLRVGTSVFGIPDHPGRVLAQLALLAPDLETEQVPSGSTAHRLAEVRAGALDAAVARLVALPDELAAELAYAPLVEEPMVLAVAADGPLAGRSHVGLDEIASQPLAFYPREQNPAWFDDVVGRLGRAGTHPVVVHEGSWIYDHLPVVARTDAVCPITASLAATIPYTGVRYVPIAPPGLRTGMGLVWRAGDATPALAALADAAALVRRGAHLG